MAAAFFLDLPCPSSWLIQWRGVCFGGQSRLKCSVNGFHQPLPPGDAYENVTHHAIPLVKPVVSSHHQKEVHAPRPVVTPSAPAPRGLPPHLLPCPRQETCPPTFTVTYGSLHGPFSHTVPEHNFPYSPALTAPT